VPDFRSTVQLNKIPVLGFVPYSSASAPSSPVDGQFWYDTTNKVLKVYNITTTAWVISELGAGVIVDSMVGAAAAIAESKLSLATDAAAGTGSRRTLGTGAAQAMPGNKTLSGIAAANANDGDVSLNSHKAVNLTDPSGPNTQDAASANWVTNAIATAVSGQDYKDAAELATIAALPANTYLSGVLTAAGNGALSVDSVAVTVGMRILVKNEVTGANNGIYDVTATGDGTHPYVLTRSSDANTSALMGSGTVVPVTGGVDGSRIWQLTTADPITLGTTSLSFAQLGSNAYAAGTGLTLTGNIFSLSNPVAVVLGGTASSTAAGARTNLVVPSFFNTAAIGDGAATVLTITHNLNNAIPLVKVWDVSGANPVAVECDIVSTSANVVTLTFATAPATGSIKAIVVG
jgi:hypothetical protein